MNTNFKNIGLLALATLSIVSCNKEDQNNEIIDYKPTSQKFKTIRDAALNNVSQTFTLGANDNSVQFTSAKGVKFTINRSCLSLNGNAVTGDVKIDFAEIFDGGKMLTTNKATMGQQADGSMAMIVSGGEFFLNAKAGGQQLSLTCGVPFQIPANLTGGIEPGMLLWNGEVDAEGNVAWRKGNAANGTGGVDAGGQGQSSTYYALFSQFGWTNVDRFYSDPRPKTTIQATAPATYDNTNCAIYLHYDGEPNGLARLDTYNSGIFSEHYGQIPIGLACHIIFATEENGQWRYAIKAATITAGATYNFTLAETSLATEAQLVAAINALP
jgi:hypothetical protein